MNKLESLTTTFFLYGKHLVVLGSMQHSAVRTNFTYNNHDDIQVLFYFIVTLQQWAMSQILPTITTITNIHVLFYFIVFSIINTLLLQY